MAAFYLNFIVACLTLHVVILRLCCGEIAHDNGFGSEIQWMTMKDGLITAKEQHKILMLIIHKSWCGACKALKPKFSASKQIRDLSAKFVMVNIQDDDEPNDIQFSPDGKYIPRIFFLEPNGDVIFNIINENGNPSYKFYYSDAASILRSMKAALIAKNDNLAPKEDF